MNILKNFLFFWLFVFVGMTSSSFCMQPLLQNNLEVGVPQREAFPAVLQYPFQVINPANGAGPVDRYGYVYDFFGALTSFCFKAMLIILADSLLNKNKFYHRAIDPKIKGFFLKEGIGEIYSKSDFLVIGFLGRRFFRGNFPAGWLG